MNKQLIIIARLSVHDFCHWKERKASFSQSTPSDDEHSQVAVMDLFRYQVSAGQRPFNLGYHLNYS